MLGSSALAFPPAPYHTLYGIVRNQVGETVTADADGNFSATLLARASIGAEHDGRTHARTLSLDTRPVPRTTLRLALDRPWAAAGESVTVTATPADGTDLERLVFTLPGGEQQSLRLTRLPQLSLWPPQWPLSSTREHLRGSLAQPQGPFSCADVAGNHRHCHFGHPRSPVQERLVMSETTSATTLSAKSQGLVPTVSRAL
jgi:hypothetical protein